MLRIVVAVVLSLIAGFALGAWLLGAAPGKENDIAHSGGAINDGSSAPIHERLLSLEQLIAEERQARLNLEDQLQVLVDQIERIDATGPRALVEQVARAEEARIERRTGQRGERNFAAMMRDMQERRLNQLIDGGFSDEQARRILKQESEIQYQAMQAAHDAKRSGKAIDPYFAQGAQSLLRDELGDSDYELYLQAQGQPTAIQITQVLSGSPGSQAGLTPGDQIVSYNGERVFDVNELRELTLQGNAGEDVIIEIVRDGVTMQLNVPRGPVGITGSGANIRNRNIWGGG